MYIRNLINAYKKIADSSKFSVAYIDTEKDLILLDNNNPDAETKSVVIMRSSNFPKSFESSTSVIYFTEKGATDYISYDHSISLTELDKILSKF